MTPGRLIFLIIGLAAIVAMAGALFDHAPTDESSETDIVILMGQSNAAYRSSTADTSTAAPVPEPGTAWYFGDQWKPLRYSDNLDSAKLWPISTSSGAYIGDKWPAIAAKYVETTGHNVVMVQLAQPGTSIVNFSPTDGMYWEPSQNIISKVLETMSSEGMTVGVTSVVWIQGEANYSMSESEYEERLLQIGTAVLNGGLGCDVLNPMWISKIRGSGGSVDAQDALVSERPGMFRYASTVATTFTVENGLMSSDNLHYSQEGNNVLGSEIGEAVGERAKAEFKMDRAIWGIIAIGIGAIVLFGAISAVTRN